MGWDFEQGAKKQDIVKELLEPQSFTSSDNPDVHIDRKTLAHKLVGNVLWMVVETDKTKDNALIQTERMIVCCLLANKRGYGWGYRGMTEAEGPAYYSCPVEFLRMVPTEDPGWRNEVLKRNMQSNGQYRDVVEAP